MKKDRKYRDSFKLNELGPKLRKYFSMMGQKAVYSVLLLFYAFKRPDTPGWAKNIIIGAIGYFLSPIDTIPDLTPFLGLTDDFGVLSFGLVSIACYINDEVRLNAKKTLTTFFNEVDEQMISEVDQSL